jgi:hypothetical protein
MEKTFKLISIFDGNDTQEFTVSEDENAETRALEELGWYIVPETEED